MALERRGGGPAIVVVDRWRQREIERGWDGVGDEESTRHCRFSMAHVATFIFILLQIKSHDDVILMTWQLSQSLHIN